jgi:hypothetical protein
LPEVTSVSLFGAMDVSPAMLGILLSAQSSFATGVT